MRFAPGSSLDVVWVAGLGARPPQPTVTVSRADGTSVALAPGHDPGWARPSVAVWCPPEDGHVQTGHAQLTGAWVIDAEMRLPAGNSLTAAAGQVAVHRTDPRRVLTSFGLDTLDATDPVLSADGQWMAHLFPDQPPGQSALVLQHTSGARLIRELYVGAPTRPRFSHTGTSLCWEGGHGSIYGIADVANPSSPVQKLSRDGDKLYHPCPCWVPESGTLLLLAVQDDGVAGRLFVIEWGSCAAQAPVGHLVGISSGSAYDHDIAPNGKDLALCWLEVNGTLRRGALNGPTILLPVPLPPTPPVVEPPPVLPDQPFVVDPAGVVEDIADWLFSPNQGPNISFSADGRHRFFCKSDEGSGDGPGNIGEDWDVDAHYIGHYEDSSAGQRVLNGQAVTPETLPAGLSPAAKAALWASLPLNRNFWTDGARVWLPRRCVSGSVTRYVTDITWTTGYVQHGITMEMRVDVGYGVIHGKPVRVRGVYASSSDGAHFNLEVNYFGEPQGYNAWIAGPFSTI